MIDNDVTLEDVECFIKILTGGDIDEGFVLFKKIPLTRREVFKIIYRLQEEDPYRIPDHYEMCECGELYDSECGGGTRQGDNAQLCESCAQHYDFCNSSCCELVPFGTVDDDGLCEKCRGRRDAE